jgi:hypothetical protein
VLKNKLIYVYLNPNQDLTNPKLSFSFFKPAFPILAVLKTDDYGIKEMIIKDGLDMTSSTLYVKKINVSKYMEIVGTDGKLYKVYIDKDGILQVQHIK